MRRAGRKRQWWPISVTMATIISVYGKAARDVLFLPDPFASPPVFLGIQRNALYSCFFRRLWRCIWRLVEAKRRRRYTHGGWLVVGALVRACAFVACGVLLLFPIPCGTTPPSSDPVVQSSHTTIQCANYYAGRPCPTPHARHLWSGTIHRSVVYLSSTVQ